MFIWNALYFGSSVKANYALQIKNIVTAARKKLGAVPVVFGECGVPMDLKWVVSLQLFLSMQLTKQQ